MREILCRRFRNADGAAFFGRRLLLDIFATLEPQPRPRPPTYLPMAPVAVLERSEEQKPFQLPDDFARYDSDNTDSASDHDVDMQKDATEEELERLVFGDSAGFRQGIKTFGRGGELVLADEEQEEEASELENVADADVSLLAASELHPPTC